MSMTVGQYAWFLAKGKALTVTSIGSYADWDPDKLTHAAIKSARDVDNARRLSTVEPERMALFYDVHETLVQATVEANERKRTK